MWKILIKMAYRPSKQDILFGLVTLALTSAFGFCVLTLSIVFDLV